MLPRITGEWERTNKDPPKRGFHRQAIAEESGQPEYRAARIDGLASSRQTGALDRIAHSRGHSGNGLILTPIPPTHFFPNATLNIAATSSSRSQFRRRRRPVRRLDGDFLRDGDRTNAVRPTKCIGSNAHHFGPTERHPRPRSMDRSCRRVYYQRARPVRGGLLHSFLRLNERLRHADLSRDHAAPASCRSWAERGTTEDCQTR